VIPDLVDSQSVYFYLALYYSVFFLLYQFWLSHPAVHTVR
jgi:hypothetical protein